MSKSVTTLRFVVCGMIHVLWILNQQSISYTVTANWRTQLNVYIVFLRFFVNSVGFCKGYWKLALPACYSLTVLQTWHFSFFVLSVSIQNNSTPVIQHLEGFFRQGEKKLRNWSLFVMWLQFVWMWSDMISDICIFLFYHVLLAHKTKNIYFPDCL